MFECIKKVVYKKQLSFSPEQYFKLENNENKYIVTYSDRNNLKTKEVSNELVIQYFDQLFRIIDGWKNHYEDTKNAIIDGTQWQLQIEYKDGEEENYIGIDKFPSNFEYLDEIKYELINNVGE